MERLKGIIERYGRRRQVAKAVEELCELQEVLIKRLNKGEEEGFKDSLISEIADVRIMLIQLQLIFNLDPAIIEATIDYKLNRQMRRIEKEADDVQVQ